jgi:two-component system, OmpR family, phosphate regulon sensor histidine kinase PhoR
MLTPELVPRVLIVEDEVGMREGIRRVLTKQGLETAMAASGEEAVRIIEKQDFPLVLVDLKMPGMDGFELLERINRIKPGTVCVVVSALATVGTIVKTTKMGTFDFVVKPFVPDELMVVVNRAIEKWRLTKETERLRAEREAHLLQLTAEKSRLKTILQSMGDGLLVVNIDNNVVLDNAAARSLLRRIDEPSQCVPVNVVIPDPKVCGQIRELLHCRQSHQVKLEMSLPPHNEREATSYLKVTLAPFQGEDGRVLGVVVLLSDITDTKAYERMKTMFISMVAHEVKAPIAAIQSYLNIIEDGILDHDVAQIKNIATRCLDRSNALLSLVQDLLEITRQEALQEKRVIQQIDMLELATKLVEFHRTLAAERGITIELCVPGSLPPLQGNVNDLERMLTNLLSNAIKYNRDGGKIWVRLESTPAAVRIEIEDTGIGMKPEDVKRAGEEFFRAKNEKTRAITGTGLGLALVKRIVKSCHGNLEIRSIPDQGSLFRILLPLSAAQSAQAAQG